MSISVIVTAYNVQEFIEPCLESLLSQTMQPLEIIVMNDGSTDGTKDRLKKYEDREHVRVIHQENQGVGASRNNGMQNAIGDYVAFIDGDDYVLPTYFETLFSAATCTNADVVISDYIKLSHQTHKEKRVKVRKVLNHKQPVQRFLSNYDEGNVVVWNKLFKRSAIKGLRFESIAYYEDVTFMTKVILQAKSFHYIPDALYVYVKHERAMTANYHPSFSQAVQWAYRATEQSYQFAQCEDLLPVFKKRVNLHVLNYKCKHRQNSTDEFNQLCADGAAQLPIYYKLLHYTHKLRIFSIMLALRRGRT